jgi:hypothetical protein
MRYSWVVYTTPPSAVIGMMIYVSGKNQMSQSFSMGGEAISRAVFLWCLQYCLYIADGDDLVTRASESCKESTFPS